MRSTLWSMCRSDGSFKTHSGGMSMQYIVKTLHFFWNNLDIHIHVNLQQKKKICLGNEIIR